MSDDNHPARSTDNPEAASGTSPADDDHSGGTASPDDATLGGISDDQLPEDLQPGEDNPLAEPLDPDAEETKSRDELSHPLHRLQKAIKRDGAIWVSWPKKASHIPTDVTEDVVRSEALKLDLVDVKVAAIDQVWSGLKLVIRVDRR